MGDHDETIELSSEDALSLVLVDCGEVVNTVAKALLRGAIQAERRRCAAIATARMPLYGLEGQNACREIASSVLDAPPLKQLAGE